MRRMTYLTVICLTLTSLLVAGCSGEESDSPSPSSSSHPPITAMPSIDAEADAAALAKVEVAVEPGKAPVFDFTPPISVTGPTARVIESGSGDVIGANSALLADVVTINGNDGQEEGSTYGGSAQILLTNEANMPLPLLELLVGAQTGARILMAGPVNDEKTTLWAFEIKSVLDLLAQAEGTQAELEAESGLPLVGYADSATTDVRLPSIVPAEGPAPDELVVQPLIVGNGAKVTAESRLVVQVVGALWDGTQFQNSWEDGVGIPIVLSGAIRGWREGLIGQTIGSQVMLVVPPDLAWGDEGKGDLIPAGSTLIYVIDILAGM